MHTHCRNYVLKSVISLGLSTLVAFPTMGAEAAESTQACSYGQAAGEAKADFLRLRDLREADARPVSDTDFRNAARRYVELAQSCYAEKYGSVAGTANQIDDGGVWFDDAADGSAEFVTFGTKWGDGSPFAGGQDVPGPGLPGGEVTYSFMPDGVDNSIEGESPNVAITSLSTFAPCFITEIENSFDAWAAVADITFTMVADDGLPFNIGGAGDIRIGAHIMDGPSGTLAHGYFPPPNGNTAAGDVHFDQHESWACVDSGPEFDFGIVALHEIGHAIGLTHENPPPAAIMNPFYNAALELLQPDDITGVESIYGERFVFCNVDTTQASYSGAETVTVSTLSVSGSSMGPVAVEWKVWLEVPTIEPVGFVNFGSDGGFVLSPEVFIELAPINLFAASDVPPGTYALGCRLLDPVTGALVNEQIHNFEVVP